MTGTTPAGPLSFTDEGAPFFWQWLEIRKEREGPGEGTGPGPEDRDNAVTFYLFVQTQPNTTPPPGVYAGKELWEDWLKDIRAGFSVRNIFRTAWGEYADAINRWTNSTEFPKWTG